MKIVWTQNALNDMQDIRDHLKVNESPAFVKKVTQEILNEVKSLEEWNTKGTLVPELEDLHLTTHRQLLAGQNRIIIERGQDVIYIHMIAHTSRDLEALIRRRLLNS
jgi:plasmid stabilization system protein ParE